ncbi:MAG: Nif3-like dinuclear metal center hexameric protein [Fibrobacter sp.]|jgi:dinuclear metal center YbgI/SA1388 family protein|nr:Nif3-like dinuclear metal center hexameric protein [Fibrobacter sp.]
MAQRKKPLVKPGVKRDSIVTFLDDFLNTASIKDYSCNGIQVQGASQIKKLALAVDASMEAYRRTAELGCEMLLVHHGIIWDGLKSISGLPYEHIKFLLDNDINLYASHLPLDLHPVVGNNAQLAKMIGLSGLKPFGLYKGLMIGFEGTVKKPISLDNLVHLLCEKLGGECTVLPFGRKEIKRIAVVSGGAAEELEEAIGKEVDCYITGEPSHINYHPALEAKINVIYAGHYYTEKPGVQALGKAITDRFGIETVFVDIPTTI